MCCSPVQVRSSFPSEIPSCDDAEVKANICECAEVKSDMALWARVRGCQVYVGAALSDAMSFPKETKEDLEQFLPVCSWCGVSMS